MSVRIETDLGIIFNGVKKEDNLTRAEWILRPAFLGAWAGVIASVASGNMHMMSAFGLVEAGILGELIRQGVVGWKRKQAEQKPKVST